MKNNTNLILTILRSTQIIGGFLFGLGAEEEISILGVPRERFMSIGMTITMISLLIITLLKKKTENVPMTDQSDQE